MEDMEESYLVNEHSERPDIAFQRFAVTQSDQFRALPSKAASAMSRNRGLRLRETRQGKVVYLGVALVVD